MRENIQNGFLQLRDLNSERERTFQTYYDSLNRFSEAKASVLDKTNELQGLKENSDQFKDEINEIYAQKKVLDAKIPELEAEKKTYVTSRNFKVSHKLKNSK